MNLSSEIMVYRMLSKVFIEGAYSTVELKHSLKKVDDISKPYITRLFYGVLDKSIQFDYIISKTANKRPKPSVAILIKIGLYLMRYSDTPQYASVNKTVELVKQVGKRGTEGFVNAVLKKSASIKLPEIIDYKSLSINSSYPEWIVKKLCDDYGFEFTKEYLTYELSSETHIRHNISNITKSEFEEKYPFLSQKSSKYGYYVTHNTIRNIDYGDYIVQSLSSVIAVEKYLENIKPENILDMCAAPGGKSVYMKQLCQDANLTACDIHLHRVELIQRYAEFANVDINIEDRDATVYNEDWKQKFDLVVCDVPCSGIGVAGKKPEILFNKTLNDVNELSKIQMEILENAKKYVTSGGRLCYSTCTTFKQENEDIVNAFLKNNTDFELDGECLSLFPHIDSCDGFFVARLRKV